MTPTANIVFAVTLFAAVSAMAMWLARRHQRTMNRRNVARRVVNTLASPNLADPEGQPDGEAEPPATAQIAS